MSFPHERQVGQNDSRAELVTGRTILHYQVLSKLGEGGMGRVYQARDLKLDRLVALKFLAPHLLESADAQSRFLSEARALSALNHPHIATIFAVEQSEGELFLVLEHLPGGTLHQKMEKLAAEDRSLSVRQILQYATQIAEGLAHAHRAGIVHRDVKTSNVLLNSEGIAKVTDFGLAHLSEASQSTHPGTTMGTPSYMSPEQALGKSVDQRTDIFSFGVVLYELATGRLPFRGDHWQAVLHQVVSVTPEPASKLRADLPPMLDRVIGQAIEKDPARRYQTMDHLVRDLADLSRQPETAASLSPTESMTVPDRRIGRRLVWLTALLLLAVLGGLVAMQPRVRATISRWTSPKLQERRMAVLPFLNVGGDPAAQAFCDGVVESLTSSLTQQLEGSALVVPSSEVRRQSVASVRDAQRSFNVNLAVTGSVQRTAGGLRVTVNLSDARSLLQLGARTVDLRHDDLTRMQDRLPGLVADLLDVQLQPQSRSHAAAGGTALPDAYDAYLQGRGYLRRYDKAGNIELALAAFRQALDRDPRYALAHAGLGEAYWRCFDRTKDPTWLEKAQAAGSRAIELNDHVAPAHISLGMIYASTGRYDLAAAEYRRALELDPVNADAYRELAGAYNEQKKIKEAEDTYRRALQLRDSDWLTHGALGRFYYRLGRLPEAETEFRKVVALTPDNATGYMVLGGLLIAMGRDAEAETVLKHSLELRPTGNAYSNLGTLYYRAGRYADSVAMFEKAVQSDGGSSYVTLGNLADACLRAPGQAEKARPAYLRAIALAEQHLAVNPKNPAVLSLLAGYRAHAGQNRQAVDTIRLARKLAPADVPIMFKAVLVYEITHRRPDALRAIEELLKHGQELQAMEREPELASLRQDASYQRVAAQFAKTDRTQTQPK